tara:strand:+ start:640 stop:1782 length:1143 start_codon:yes stop_codon:yes gene_type:complete
MMPILLALPWIGIIVFLLFFPRPAKSLPVAAVLDQKNAPSVSVIIPARNEAINIEACLDSITKSSYPNFEIIVVNDRSEDETATLARSMSHGNAKSLIVIDGEELPEGWLGKPWACYQGARATSSQLLLFTDADTKHGNDLLSRSVLGIQEEEADLLNVIGFQLMESFWECLVQPQIFLMILFYFPNLEQSAQSNRWRDAVANGQFIMMQRASYEAIGGHESVRDRVIEDVALAQLVKRSGGILAIRLAMDDLTTRMYRSLSGLIAGWSRLFRMGAIQGQALLPSLKMVALMSIFLWIMPPVMLISALSGLGGMILLNWSLLVCGISIFIHITFLYLLGGPVLYAVFYPLGSLMLVYIMIIASVSVREVEWKGRKYEVSD